MTDWFRSWHGAPTHPKWRTIARRAGVRTGEVIAVVWVLFDRASQAKNRGSIEGYDVEVIADSLGFEVKEIEAIIEGLSTKGVIIDGRIKAWEKHQPKREDDSSDRVRAFRQKQAEKQAEKPPETPRNAPKRTREDTDTEIKKEREKENSLSQFFDRFWEAYPHKVARVAAEEAFEKVLSTDVDPEFIIAGAARYEATKPKDSPYCNPAKWLLGRRWEDQPAISNGHAVPNGEPKEVYHVGVNTPEWEARLKAGHKPSMVSYNNRLYGADGGWTFFTKLPPESAPGQHIGRGK